MRDFPWKLILGVCAIAFIIWALVGVAFGQDTGIVVAVPPTDVVFNWGDFLAILLANLAQPDSVAWTIFGLAMTWLVTQLPGPLKTAFNVFRVEQLLSKALAGGINSTRGAVQGQTLNLDVGSEVFAKALQYALDNGSKGLIEWMGGAQGIQQKLIARLPADETVDGAALVRKASVIDKTVTS